jgi:hypothetical protein
MRPSPTMSEKVKRARTLMERSPCGAARCRAFDVDQQETPLAIFRPCLHTKDARWRCRSDVDGEAYGPVVGEISSNNALQARGEPRRRHRERANRRRWGERSAPRPMVRRPDSLRCSDAPVSPEAGCRLRAGSAQGNREHFSPELDAVGPDQATESCNQQSNSGAAGALTAGIGT